LAAAGEKKIIDIRFAEARRDIKESYPPPCKPIVVRGGRQAMGQQRQNNPNGRKIPVPRSPRRYQPDAQNERTYRYGAKSTHTQESIPHADVRTPPEWELWAPIYIWIKNSEMPRRTPRLRGTRPDRKATN
jgi:hypothetical protein